MAANVKPIPDGYHSITPYLIVKGAHQAIEFYSKAFGARETMRIDGPEGRIGHAEMKIGDCIVMLADEHPEMNYVGPQTLGGSPVSLMIYVENVDAVFKRAIEAGAKEQRPVEDKFYGDRMGSLEDPFGHIWHVSTHVEDVTPDEMARRAAEMSQ